MKYNKRERDGERTKYSTAILFLVYSLSYYNPQGVQSQRREGSKPTHSLKTHTYQLPL